MTAYTCFIEINWVSLCFIKIYKVSLGNMCTGTPGYPFLCFTIGNSKTKRAICHLPNSSDLAFEELRHVYIEKNNTNKTVIFNSLRKSGA